MSAPQANGILFAAGPRGTLLTPQGARLVSAGREPDPAPARSGTEQRALVAAALNDATSGPTLHELAKDKRRAVILAGDQSRPAPYDIVLPVLVAELVKAGIRPSRIALAACPGGAGPLLGHAAIRRYGEELCGEHEAVAWPDAGTPGEWFDSADLKIAVAPRVDDLPFAAFLPPNVSADYTLELGLGRKVSLDLEFARRWNPGEKPSEAAEKNNANPCTVFMSSGGGSPWEETLEEALLSLHLAAPAARTAVLVFSGAEGLGSARFTCDLWSLIEQAEALLAGGGELPRGNVLPGPRFDPAAVLAGCLSRYSNTVLFAPLLAQHPDGEDLLERLDAAPAVGARLSLCAEQSALWAALAALHGPDYELRTEPLGWRRG